MVIVDTTARKEQSPPTQSLLSTPAPNARKRSTFTKKDKSVPDTEAEETPAAKKQKMATLAVDTITTDQQAVTNPHNILVTVPARPLRRLAPKGTEPEPTHVDESIQSGGETQQGHDKAPSHFAKYALERYSPTPDGNSAASSMQDPAIRPGFFSKLKLRQPDNGDMHMEE